MKSRSSTRSHLLIGTLGLCAYVESQFRPASCPCPEIFSPVCAQGVTHQNPCTAACKGAFGYTAGPCKANSLMYPGSIFGGYPGGVPGGFQGGAPGGFPGGILGSVPGGFPGGMNPGPQGWLGAHCPQCTDSVSPVCGTNSQTYQSLCIADCFGVTVRSIGPCLGGSLDGSSQSSSGVISSPSVFNGEEVVCGCNDEVNEVFGRI